MDLVSCHQDSKYLVAIVQTFMVCTAVLCKLQSCVVMLLFQLDPKQRHQVDPTAAVGSHTHPNIQWKLLTLNDTNVQTCTSFVLVFLQVLNSVQQLTFI